MIQEARAALSGRLQVLALVLNLVVERTLNLKSATSDEAGCTRHQVAAASCRKALAALRGMYGVLHTPSTDAHYLSYTLRFHVASV